MPKAKTSNHQTTQTIKPAYKAFYMENILNRCKKVQKVDAPPFLMTRIRAKIQAVEAEKLPVFWRWAGATAVVLLLWLNYMQVVQPENNNIAAQFGLYQSAQLYAYEN